MDSVIQSLNYWRPFLERSGNLTGPKSYFEIKVLRKVGSVLTSNRKADRTVGVNCFVFVPDISRQSRAGVEIFSRDVKSMRDVKNRVTVAA